MIALILALFALRLHLAGLVPTPPPPPVPVPAVVVAPTSGRAHGASRGPSGTSRAGRPSGGAAIPLPQPPAAPVTVPPAAPVPAPGPDSPVCDAGQSPAVDGCAQGQLPEETLGRAYG